MNQHAFWKACEGTQFSSKYYLQTLLGVGGFGAVFQADEVVADRRIRTIALKIFNPFQTPNLDTFIQEFQSTATLRHPHLIETYVPEEGKLQGAIDALGLVMELAGEDLGKRLEKLPLTPAEATILVRHVAGALRYLHGISTWDGKPTKGIVHRDIKPQNIMAVGSGANLVWKVGDLGIVRVLGHQTATMTTNRQGSPFYVPPEAYSGEVSPAMDVWALGVTIVQALTLQVPFPGPTEAQVMHQVLNEDPKLPPLPDPFEAIVRGCFNKNPKSRWTAEQVLEALNPLPTPKQDRENRDNEGALADYNQAIRLNPDDADAYRNRGKVKSELGDNEGAIADYNQAIRLNPDFANAYAGRGLAKYFLGDNEGAIADYNQSIRLDPDDAVPYNNRGLAKSELGDNEGAVADYNQSIRLDPDDAVPYNNRGLAKSELGDNEGAIADYTQAIRLNPDSVVGYINRGHAKSALGDEEGAIADYTQAIRLNPDLTEAYVGRGFTKYVLGDEEGAIADYTQAIRLNPDDADAYAGRGHAKSDLGDEEGAIADYTQAIRIFPDNAYAYVVRGKAKSDLGDEEGAIADYTQAIRIFPCWAKAYVVRGKAKSALGDKEGAIADYNQAIRLNPDNAKAYKNRGHAYRKLGENQQALRDFRVSWRLFQQ